MGVDEIKTILDFADCGYLKEYVGCKVDIEGVVHQVKLTERVMVQSLRNEFNLPTKEMIVPAEAGSVLVSCNDLDLLSDSEAQIYRKGTGKLHHLTRWMSVIQVGIKQEGKVARYTT